MRKSYLWAGIITVGLAGWMASPYYLPKLGLGAPPAEEAATGEAAVEAATEAKLFKVRVKAFKASSRQTIVTANGVTEASAHIEARARTGGVIISSSAQQGRSVKAGDTLCTLDEASRKAQWDQAEAAVASAQRDYDASSDLARKGITSKATVLDNRAKLDAAKAALATVTADMNYLVVKAPVAGVLIDKPAEVGSLLAVGGLCANISQLDPLLATVQVSESYIAYLVEGMGAKAKLATGEEVDGRVRFIAKSADLATRTFRVELELANPGEKMRAGVSADMSVALPATQAHKLPGSILSLNDKGQFGVRVLTAGNITTFTPVNVVAQEVDGIWVTGLEPEVTIVTTGQDYVRDGEKVEPVVETAEITQ